MHGSKGHLCAAPSIAWNQSEVQKLAGKPSTRRNVETGTLVRVSIHLHAYYMHMIDTTHIFIAKEVYRRRGAKVVHVCRTNAEVRPYSRVVMALRWMQPELSAASQQSWG